MLNETVISSKMPNPLDTISDWANENIVEPLVDLADELGDDAAAAADEIAGLVSDVGTAIGQIAGDVLRAMGLDPEQLAEEFLALSENALRAFLDFLNAIKNMQEKVNLLINAKNIVGNNDLSFQQQFSPNHIQAAMVL